MDRQTVRALAALSRLHLDEAQEARAEAHMSRLLEHFAQLEEVDTSAADPAPYPLDLAPLMRPDEPEAALSRDDVLGNAPAQRAGAFQVPRIVE